MAKKTPTTKPVVPEKPAPKPTAKAKKTVAGPDAKKAPGKASAPKTKPSPKTPKPKAKVPAYTIEDISLRAYFIGEKRRAQWLPGDEHQDWLEAERQLAAESKSAKKPKKA